MKKRLGESVKAMMVSPQTWWRNTDDANVDEAASPSGVGARSSPSCKNEQAAYPNFTSSEDSLPVNASSMKEEELSREEIHDAQQKATSLFEGNSVKKDTQ